MRKIQNRRPWTIPILLFLIVGIAGAGWWGVRLWRDSSGADVDTARSGFYGGVLDPPRPAPDFALNDQRGGVFRLSEQRGDVVVLFFGYTMCPDVCPMTLAQYLNVKERLGGLADRVQFVFVTVDPERDTQERLAEYIAHFDPAFHGLWAEPEPLEEVWRQYGVFVERVERPESRAGYTVNHSSISYVIDTEGNLRLAHLFGTPNDQIAHDIEKLLSSAEGGERA